MTMLAAVGVLLAAVPDAGFIWPADVLRAASAGATRLVLQPADAQAKPVAVDSANEIAALLALIDIPAVPAGRLMHHLCDDGVPVRLFKDGRLLTEWSIDHATMVRPRSKNLWGDSDVELTPASARAVAAWFGAHGYRGLTLALDRAESEREQEAKRMAKRVAPLPPALHPLLSQEPKPGAFAAAIPDPVDRVRRIAHALAADDGSWTAFLSEHTVLLAAIAELPASTVAEAVMSFPDGSEELRGSTRLIFGSPLSGESVLRRLPPAAAIPVARRLAPIAFRGLPENASAVPGALWRLKSPELIAVLSDEARQAERLPDPPQCDRLQPAPAPIGALLVLADWGALAPDQLKVRASGFRCAETRAALETAAAFAKGQLPRAAALKGSDATTGRLVLERIKAAPSRAGIELAVAALLDHDWGVIAHSTEAWLKGLSGGKDVRAWWAGARATWK